MRVTFLGFVGIAVLVTGCGEGAPTNTGGAGAGTGLGGGAGAAGSSPSSSGGAGAGTSSGASSSGGSANGGTPGGGMPGGGGGGMPAGAGSSSGASGGGSGSGTGGGGGMNSGPMNVVFSECRLHFGTIDAKAKENPAVIPELDFFTSAWMGQSDRFDQNFLCEEAKPGAVLGKQVPVLVAYVSAFYLKRHHGNLCDCNVTTCGQTDGKANDLCHFGAQYIKQDLSKIVDVYKAYAQGYAGCYGTTRPIVFEMEPDWYQYTSSEQVSPLTKEEAGSIMGQYVDAMKQYLPNAHFSIDISPWVDDNGVTNGKDWYSHFDLSKFTFANTSGGSTSGNDSLIRPNNMMTWAGVSQVTGKPLLADTGYGANGMSAGHDAKWDDPNSLNQRLADGVISISQYNPKPDWASTIKSIRAQLGKPKFCP